jgi:hypothetical protein
VAKLALADCPRLLLLTARFLIARLVMLGAAAGGGTDRKVLGRATNRLGAFEARSFPSAR